MTTAVAEIDAGAPAAKPNPLLDGFNRLSTGRKALLGVSTLALVALLATGFFMANQPDYKVLYANLNDKDGGAVLAQLSQMNVPYKHADAGGAILVPADRVAGFDTLDTNRLGMTQFQERLTFQRGLEGELTRSISSLSSVAEARVHLALPAQNGFFRAQQKPSASVLLNLYPGRSLDRTQIAGIVHLVASSVPEMDPKAVSVVDQNGALLSQTADADHNGVDAKQLEYTRRLEQMFTQRILDLLEPVLGRDNVRAQVTADLDFSQTEQTSEQHRPNQSGEPSTVRSQQLIEARGDANNTPVPGTPGAVANAAPTDTQAPVNGTAAPVGVFNDALGPNGRREQVTNYEVDKTVSVTRGATGQVRRLSAAVVVNHVETKDRKGQASTGPLPQEQMDQINALVREAIGFSTQRGDSVNVMNAAFNRTVIDTPEVPWWQDAQNQDLARSLAWPVGLLLMGLIVLMGMVRPALKMMQPQPVDNIIDATGATPIAGSQLNAVVDDDTQRPVLPQPVQNEVTVEMLRLEDAKRLARENPVAVANIVKGWVNGESVPATT